MSARKAFSRLVRLAGLVDSYGARALCFCLSIFLVPMGLAKPLSQPELRAMFAKEMPKIFRHVAPPAKSLQLGEIGTKELITPSPFELSKIAQVKLIGPERLAKEVVLVANRATLDELHAFWHIFKEMGENRPRLHILAAKESGLSGLRVAADEFAKFATINPYVQVSDPWLRDCSIPVSLQVKGVTKPVLAVLDPLRGGALSSVPQALVKRWNVPRILPPDLKPEWGGDNGGNFLVTPDGIAIVGGNCSRAMRRFVAGMGYGGRLLTVDMWWRFGGGGGGHVDEVFTVLPVPEEPNGYVIGVADPAMGLKLLGEIKRERIVDELRGLLSSLYQLRHLYPQSFSKDEAVLGMKMAEEVGKLYGALEGGRGPDYFAANLSKNLAGRLSSVIEMTIANLEKGFRALRPGKPHVRFVRLPSLLRHEDDGRGGSMLPEVVNSIILGNDVISPDPLLAPFRKKTRELLAALGFRCHFIPSATYHNQRGQIHCATVVKRSLTEFIHPQYEPGK